MSELSINSKLARTLARAGEVGNVGGGWETRISQLTTEITGVNPNPTNVFVAGFAECRLALGAEYTGYLTAATQYVTAPDAPYDFDPDKLVATVGAPISHERTAGQISREKYGALYFLFLLVLFMMVVTGCTPAPAAAEAGETETPTYEPTTVDAPTDAPDQIPTSTATVEPTEQEPTVEMDPTDEPTPTLEATVEPQQVPDYMQPYFEGGFDKMCTENELFFMYDEASIHYAPGDGIVVNERIIKSWIEIDYVEDGVTKRGIILNLVIRGGDGLFKDYGKFVWASSMSQMGTNPSLSFMQNNDNFFADSTPGDGHPILHAQFTNHPTGDAELYEGIFPSNNGTLEPVNIPGIGTVLPISNIKPLSIP